MTELEKTILSLKAMADETREAAYASIGGAPGPGVDIALIPTNPISHIFRLQGLTPAGLGWIAQQYPDAIIIAGRDMRTMKEALDDWGLTWKTDWSNIVEVA